MNPSKLIVLGIAAVAFVGAFVLMMGRSPSEGPVQIVQPATEETVRVLVVSRDIQRGERLSSEDTDWVVWPKKAVQPTFITDTTPERRDEIAGAVARSLLVTGEPVMDAKIVTEESGGMMSALLTPGMRAVTIRVSPETSSGGFILPGDRVDLLHTVNNRTRLVFEDVRVLAVNTIVTENLDTPHIAGSNITLELSPEDAAVFTDRRAEGAFSVVLRSIFKPEGEIASKDRRSSDVTVYRYGRS